MQDPLEMPTQAEELNNNKVLAVLFLWENEKIFEAKELPKYLLDDLYIKLFTKSKLSGLKGLQDDIIENIVSNLTVTQLYDLDLIDDNFLIEFYNKDND